MLTSALETPDERDTLLRPFPVSKMEWVIGKAVGNVRSDYASLIDRVAA